MISVLLPDNEIVDRWDTFQAVANMRLRARQPADTVRHVATTQHAIVTELAGIAEAADAEAEWIGVLSLLDAQTLRLRNNYSTLFRQIYAQLGREYWEDTMKRYGLS